MKKIKFLVPHIVSATLVAGILTPILSSAKIQRVKEKNSNNQWNFTLDFSENRGIFKFVNKSRFMQITTINNPTEVSFSEDSINTGCTEPVDYSSNVKYEYDNLNRLTKAVYGEENYVVYEYDANGNMTKVTVVNDGTIQ